MSTAGCEDIGSKHVIRTGRFMDWQPFNKDISIKSIEKTNMSEKKDPYKNVSMGVMIKMEEKAISA